MTDKFTKAAESLGNPGRVSITTARTKFESEWKKSKPDDQISSGFDFKTLGTAKGEYRLCQIRAGFDYRLAIVLVIRGNRAYWVHAWKKTKLRNKEQEELAKNRAAQLWAEIEKGGM